jgi:hypothetical protein
MYPPLTAPSLCLSLNLYLSMAIWCNYVFIPNSQSLPYTLLPSYPPAVHPVRGEHRVLRHGSIHGGLLAKVCIGVVSMYICH